MKGDGADVTGLRRERGGAVTLDLEAEEAAVLRGAFAELQVLLSERDGTGAADGGPPEGPAEVLPGVLDPFTADAATELPADPALARLLPDAYRDDAEAAAEYRRFTEGELLAKKHAHMSTLLRTLGDGGEIRLGPEQVHAWLCALNDLRLTLGSRLAIDEGYEAMLDSLDPQDPRLPALHLYEWLTALQDALVRTQG